MDRVLARHEPASGSSGWMRAAAGHSDRSKCKMIDRLVRHAEVLSLTGDS
jgi:hypothetical protein